ncbi:transposase family protein [Desulfonema ishimotonii]|uniref:transposase family protein n=1 Tax=Desulfonema ishimotonii TaxID=45657 RepID=UPI00350E3881
MSFLPRIQNISYLTRQNSRYNARRGNSGNIITDPEGRIRAVSKTYPGKTHDFAIYKKQKRRDRFPGIPKKADNGYQGIRKYDRKCSDSL